MKDSKNSFAGSAGEKPDFDCVKKIHGDADGNGFSVADFEFRELLKFVGDPVAEVERGGPTRVQRGSPEVAMCST